MPSEKAVKTYTYKTRLRCTDRELERLQSCATLFSHIERELFAEVCRGKKADSLKSEYIAKYNITARQFNSIKSQLEGKIAARIAVQKEQIIGTEAAIEETKRSIERFAKRPRSANKLHQKKRRLNILQARLQRFTKRQEQKKVSLCFGTKRLFRAQFSLEANGYATHAEWLADWQASRENGFFLIGSKDETGGNQSCTATLDADGSISLRLRLPDYLVENGEKYLFFTGVRFAYGHDKIAKTLEMNEERKRLKSNKDQHAALYGRAISYRFKKDKKGWEVSVTVDVDSTPRITTSHLGVIGVDINADHLAAVETDRFGNPIAKTTIPLTTYGKSKNQAKALVGDVCKEVVELAKVSGKSLVIEQLDFRKKRASLREVASPKNARMLSSFSYNAICQGLDSRAWREGVEVVAINPAFTSLIGRIKFSKRYGLSIHHSAALAIGRRFLQASERVPRHLDQVPDGKGGYVALSQPVRNGCKHVWSLWGKLNRELKTVLAAHFRATSRRSSSYKNGS